MFVQTPLFAKGDTVVVVKGDLTDLMGKVLRVRQVSREDRSSFASTCSSRIRDSPVFFFA